MSTAIDGYPTSSPGPLAQNNTVAVDANEQGRRWSTASSIDDHFSPQQRRQSEALSMISNVQSLRAGKLPTNEQLSSTMDRLLSSKIIERNRSHLSEDGQVLLRDFQELMLALQRALQTKNRDELFQSFVYHVRRSEQALKEKGVTEDVSAGMQQEGSKVKEEAKLTGKEILKVLKLFLFNSQFRALLGQILSIAQQTMGDTMKLSGKKMQETAGNQKQSSTGQFAGARIEKTSNKLKKVAAKAVNGTKGGDVGMALAKDVSDRNIQSRSGAVGGKRHSLPVSNKEFPQTHFNFLNNRFENTDTARGVTDDAGHTLEDDKLHGAVLHRTDATENRMNNQHHHLQGQRYQQLRNASGKAAKETPLQTSSQRDGNVFLANLSATQPTADPKNEMMKSMEVGSINGGSNLQQRTSSNLPDYNAGDKQLKAFMTDSVDVKPLESIYRGMHDQSLSSFSTGFLGNTIRTAGDYRREEFYGRSATTTKNASVADPTEGGLAENAGFSTLDTPQLEFTDDGSTQRRSSNPPYEQHSQTTDLQDGTRNRKLSRYSMSDALAGAYFNQENGSEQQRRGSIDAYYSNNYNVERKSNMFSEDDNTSAPTQINKILDEADDSSKLSNKYGTNTNTTKEICPGMTSIPAFASGPSLSKEDHIVGAKDNANRNCTPTDQTEGHNEDDGFVGASSGNTQHLQVGNHANNYDTADEMAGSGNDKDNFIKQQAMNDIGAAYITSSAENVDSTAASSVDKDTQLSSKVLLQGAGLNTNDIEESGAKSSDDDGEDSVSAKEVINNLKEILTTIQKNAEYQQAINTLISLFGTWGSRISSGKEQFDRRRSSAVSGSEQADYYLNLATAEAKTIIEDWARGASLDPLLRQTSEAVSGIRHDSNVRNLFDTATNYVKRLLKEPGYLASDESTEDGNQIFNEFKQSKSRNKIIGKVDSLIQAYSTYIRRISNDATSKQISRKIQDIHDHLWYNSDGRATFKPQLLNDMRICLLPALIEQIKYVPLPNVLYSDKQYDIAIENMVLQGNTLMPNIIEIRADDYLRFSPNTKLSYTNSQSLTVHLSGVQAVMEEAVFYYKRKSGFPRVSDSGVVSLNTGGRGLSVSMRLVTSSVDELHTFRADQCHCQIDKLNISVKSCKHNVLYKVFNPMLTGIIKRQVCKAVERKVTEMVEAGDARVTSLLHRKQQARGEQGRRNSAGNTRPGLFAHVSNIVSQKVASI